MGVVRGSPRRRGIGTQLPPVSGMDTCSVSSSPTSDGPGVPPEDRAVEDGVSSAVCCRQMTFCGHSPVLPNVVPVDGSRMFP